MSTKSTLVQQQQASQNKAASWRCLCMLLVFALYLKLQGDNDHDAERLPQSQTEGPPLLALFPVSPVSRDLKQLVSLHFTISCLFVS